MSGMRMLFRAASADEAMAALEGAWAEYVAASPDLDGRDLAYEANWRGTLGLDPEDVRSHVARAAVLLPFGPAAAAASADVYRRESSAAWAAGDDARAFELECVAEYCGAAAGEPLWEASTEDTLAPAGVPPPGRRKPRGRGVAGVSRALRLRGWRAHAGCGFV